MPARCTRDACGGNLFLELLDDSASCGGTAMSSEYVCSLCGFRSSPPTPLPTAAEYTRRQSAEASLSRSIALYARKAVS